MKMKKLIFTVILFYLFICASAAADIVEGAWNGVGQAMGKTTSVSANFDGQGGFTAFGMGMSVSGVYTLYDDSVTLSAQNMSISFSYSTDGSVESLTGSITYMGVSGTITLTRDVAQTQIPNDESEETSELIVDDVYAEWTNDDRTAYSLSLYRSGFCVLSITDTSEADVSLVSSAVSIGQTDSGKGIADLMAAVANSKASVHSYTYPAKFEISEKALSIKFLDNTFSDSPQSFFTSSWDEGSNTISLSCSGGKGAMDIRNAEGKVLTFTALALKGDVPDDERFWRYFPVEKGAKGDNVKLLQEKLIEKGFLSDKADGAFGNNTKAAIEALQEKNGLEVTGIADESVWSALLDG